MAGIPGKGGVKGRSGRKPLDPSVRRQPYSITLPSDVRDAARAAGTARVEAILRESLM